MVMQQMKKKIIQQTRKTLWRKSLCLVPVLRPRDRGRKSKDPFGAAPTG